MLKTFLTYFYSVVFAKSSISTVAYWFREVFTSYHTSCAKDMNNTPNHVSCGVKVIKMVRFTIIVV